MESNDEIDTFNKEDEVSQTAISRSVEIFDLDSELENVQNNINELIEVYGSIVKQANDNRESYTKDISDLIENIRVLKKTCEENLINQELEQKEFRELFKENSINQLERLKNNKETAGSQLNFNIQNDVKELQRLHELLLLQAELADSEKQEINLTYAPNDLSTKRLQLRYNQLYLEVLLLRKKVRAGREGNDATINEFQKIFEERGKNQEAVKAKLQKEVLKRQAQYDRHIEVVKSLLESERAHTLNEVKSADECLKAVKVVRKAFRRECAKKIKHALREIKFAESALDDAGKLEELEVKTITGSQYDAISTQNTYENLKSEEKRIHDALSKLNRQNKAIFDLLFDSKLGTLM